MIYDLQALKAQQDTDDERIAILQTLVAQFMDGFFAEIDTFIEAATAAGLRGMRGRVPTQTPNTMTVDQVCLFGMPLILALTPHAALTLSGGVLAYHLVIYRDAPAASSETPLFDLTFTDGVMPRAVARQTVRESVPFLTKFLFHADLSVVGGHAMAAWLIQDISQLYAVWPDDMRKTPLLETPWVGMSRSVGSITEG